MKACVSSALLLSFLRVSFGMSAIPKAYSLLVCIYIPVRVTCVLRHHTPKFRSPPSTPLPIPLPSPSHTPLPIPPLSLPPTPPPSLCPPTPATECCPEVPRSLLGGRSRGRYSASPPRRGRGAQYEPRFDRCARDQGRRARRRGAPRWRV